MKIMTFRAPDELHEKFKQICKQLGRTRNDLILQILWDWVKKNT